MTSDKILIESVHNANSKSAFFRGWFERHGIDPRSVIDRSAFLQLPVVELGELRDRLVHTPESRRAEILDTCDVLLRAGVRKEDRVVIAVSFGGYGFGFMTFAACDHIGAVPFPVSLSLTTERLLESITQYQPAVLVTTPSRFQSLTELIRQDRHTAPACIRTVFLHGETLPIDRRRELAALWRCAVEEIYAVDEVGCIGISTSEHDGILLRDQSIHLDLLEPHTGEPGEEFGHAVVTILDKERLPVVRCRIGHLLERTRITSTSGQILTLLKIRHRSAPHLSIYGGAHIAFERLVDVVQREVPGATLVQTAISTVLPGMDELVVFVAAPSGHIDETILRDIEVAIGLLSHEISAARHNGHLRIRVLSNREPVIRDSCGNVPSVVDMRYDTKI